MKFCWKRWRAIAPLTAKNNFASAAIFAAVALGGCAPSLPPPSLSLAEQRVFFAVSGSIAARDENGAHLANFRWRRRTSGGGIFSDIVHLEAPPGSAFARITVTPESAALKTARREYRAADPEQLMEQALGWRLPLAGLGYWIAGRPAPQSPRAMRVAVDGLAREIVQDGWRIAIDEYGDDRLPRKLALVRGGFSAEIAIAGWQTPPP